MKTFPTLILAAAIGGAGFAGGYWLGHRRAAAPAPAKARGARNVFRAVLFDGTSGADVDWKMLLSSTNKVDPNLLEAWARSLGPGDIAADLRALRQQPDSQRRNELMAALYNVWAEQDPKAFLADSKNIAVPRLREQGIDAALKAWAAADPKGALQWLKDNPGTESAAAESARYAAAIAGYAVDDPLGAVAMVGALGDSNPHDQALKSAATTALADALSDQGQFMQAASFFSHLPPGATRDGAYAELAQRWSQAAPQDAAAWVEGLSGDPQLKATMGMQVAQTWAQLDPAAAANWAAKIDLPAAGANSAADGSTNGQLLATAVRAWTDYDLDSAGEFLNQLPNSPAKDSAVAIFALRASQENPQEVFPWVNTITDDQLRMRLTAAVALQWMQQDQAGFQQFLGNTTLLSDQQKQLLENMPPQALAGMAQLNTLLGGGSAAQNLIEKSIIQDSDGVNRNVPSPDN